MNKKIVVIPFNLPWEWSTDYTNQTAFELAKNGTVVCCYLWSDVVYLKDTILHGNLPKFIKRYSKNIYLITPWYFIPLRRFKFVMKLNSLINVLFLRAFTEIIRMSRSCRKAYFWIFDPNTLPIYRYFGKEYSLIYDCVDYFPGAVTPDLRKKTIKNEQELLTEADLVVANSKVLQTYLLKYRKKVGLVPQGFRLDTFNNRYNRVLHIKRGKRPLIGFVGAVNHRIDYELLYNLARNNPVWDFALWGRLLEKELFTDVKEIYYKKLISLPNVITGQSDKKDIPMIIKQFDLGMIPYDMTLDFNKYCYPMKIFEYFYLGKPVISSDVVELRRFPDTIKIGRNKGEWEKIIRKILSSPWPKELILKEKRLAKENSWKAKVKKILSFIG